MLTTRNGRSETSLIQTIGRAARNVNAEVILYADRVTDSIQRALAETNRRRDVQRLAPGEHGLDESDTILAPPLWCLLFLAEAK